MSVIRINYAAVDATVDEMGRTRDELTSLLGDFTTSSDSMVASMDGQERAAYETTKARTQQEFDALSRAIDATRTAVMNHKENTRALDAAHAAKWGG